ncbi:hypothetical protein Leryth_016827 [Lithospermum erythrorhizon]|nr:hypothetical protein Leryth_016827 [Lithospermum erythrorhizon]
MKEIEKKRGPNNNQTKRSTKSERKDNKLPEKNSGRTLKTKESDIKNLSARFEPIVTLVSDSNTGSEASEVHENMDIHYADDVHKSDLPQNSSIPNMVEKENKEKVEDHSTDAEEGMEDESETESTNDSIASHGSVQSAEDITNKRTPSVPRGLVKTDAVKGASKTIILKSDRKANSSQINMKKDAPKQVKRPIKNPSKGIVQYSNENPGSVKVHPKPLSESSDGVDDIALEEVNEADLQDKASNNTNCVESDDAEENAEIEDKTTLNLKVGEMEDMIERLEEELREVAALEVALYSVVPEHGNSAHKVHTPARRLSRLYLHACKYWSQGRRATVARNTVSGLVLIARSCGNDVSRLTFWLSNSVVLREIISQAFGTSCQPNSLSKILESNGEARRSELKCNAGSKKAIGPDLIQFIDDWQQTRTFTAALEKVEAWIFSRVVESIWWQTLTPNMQAPIDDSSSNKASGRLLGPTLGDQQQGNFSISLWKNAFQDACRRLCPVRAGGHECGCLPVLARQVMEQCVRRLDVAMFNAILRESVHEIPSDPVSDPIVDSRVLPIPAGDLSFGSGAQLKNSVGNWSRCLNEFFGTDSEIPEEVDKSSRLDDGKPSGYGPKCFPLLNELSDLLMLPKDMVMDRSVRTEVCPSIGLPLVKRILCNFSPDEFCPDPVPGSVLEALNAECIIERRLSRDSTMNCFPCPAAPITYAPPSSANVAEKVAEARGSRQFSRSTSSVQKKGYTSDEELQELDSPLRSIVDKLPQSHNISDNGSGKEKDNAGGNVRYELLREVWMTT